jgi:hypothetical protein
MKGRNMMNPMFSLYKKFIMKRKTICIVLAFAFCMSLAVPMVALTSEITEEYVYSRLMEMKTKYPNGATLESVGMTDGYVPEIHPYFWEDYQDYGIPEVYLCSEFAWRVSDEIFGKLPLRLTTWEELRPGDLIEGQFPYGHIVVVLSVSDNAVTVVEGNILPNGTIRWEYNYSKERIIRGDGVYYTRYPDTGSSIAPTSPAATQPPFSDEIIVIVNGEAIVFDQPPIIENGRTLVPLRAIFEALGARVEWDAKLQIVYADRSDVSVTLPIGSTTMYRGFEEVTLDVPAKIVGGRTLVPARAVAESFGADVTWDQSTRTVTITE